MAEEERRKIFPVVRSKIFFAHAGVSPLPAPVAEAMANYLKDASKQAQEFEGAWKVVQYARHLAAEILTKKTEEVALLGPTSLGLSLFSNGLKWEKGDEVILYRDDYPANVYPWLELRAKGVIIKTVEPKIVGRILVDDVLQLCTEKTRLVALPSCHYLTGWRIETEKLAQELKKRDILFSLDAIQTLGAFPTNCADVDFVSADSHKWLLGPMSAGIVAVSQKNFGTCRPVLLGAWNVRCPDFLTQEEIEFETTARRYEPGALNIVGIWGLAAAIELLKRFGLSKIEEQILKIRDALEEGLEKLGWEFLSPLRWEPLRSGIVTTRPKNHDTKSAYGRLLENGIVVSLRTDRKGQKWIRFSPHFYNTLEEVDRVLDLLSR
ncbi:MAG: aminotransferase class V-fold PLP-dependent enzyme [Chthoniobacterales bacterium]|nr:aminotransferase class V-fold PLP-dependent enzyme [Chthoniobacterales bacterium]